MLGTWQIPSSITHQVIWHHFNSDSYRHRYTGTHTQSALQAAARREMPYPWVMGFTSPWLPVSLSTAAAVVAGIAFPAFIWGRYSRGH